MNSDANESLGRRFATHTAIAVYHNWGIAWNFGLTCLEHSQRY
jgi:hypothetical protein